jgi:hypothetical protein
VGLLSVYRIRKDKDNPYVMVNKHFIHDPQLSYKAKGILLYLLSRPDDWQVYEIEIAKHAKDGRESVRNGIKELLAAGYIKRGQMRQGGKFNGYDYEVFECPHRVGKPDNGKPDNGESDTTNKRSKLSKEGTEILYINLPLDDAYLKTYNDFFVWKFGANHMRVTPEQAERIERCVDRLKDCDVNAQDWHEAVREHFFSLPDSNNGNILAFLAASMRYFEVDLRNVV